MSTSVSDELTPFHYHTALMKKMPHIPRTLVRQLDDVTPHEFRIEADTRTTPYPIHRIWRGDFLIGYTGTHHIERSAFGSTRYEKESCLYVLKGFTPNTHAIPLPNGARPDTVLEHVCTFYNASVRYYNEQYGAYVDWSNERHLEQQFQSIAARRALDRGYFDFENTLRKHLKRLVISAGLELLHRPFDAVDVAHLSVSNQTVRYNGTLVAYIRPGGQDTVVTFERGDAISYRYLGGNATDADILSFLVDDLSDALRTMRRDGTDRYLENGDTPSPDFAEQVIPLLVCADAHNHHYGLPYFKD